MGADITRQDMIERNIIHYASYFNMFKLL